MLLALHCVEHSFFQGYATSVPSQHIATGKRASRCDACSHIRHFRALYTFRISLHPMLLLSDELLVDFSNVFEFFEDTGLLHRLQLGTSLNF